MNLERILSLPKSGNEKLSCNGAELPHSLLDFWRWSVSDLLSNATRGRFAEFIVATATNIDVSNCRDEWGAFDLQTADGIKIEVKSAAYLQSWFQATYSRITFSIKESLSWSAEENKFSDDKKRQAEVYVFCLLNHKDKQTVDPLKMNQWEFYVLSTKTLNEIAPKRKSISLTLIKSLTRPVSYIELADEIRKNALQN